MGRLFIINDSGVPLRKRWGVVVVVRSDCSPVFVRHRLCPLVDSDDCLRHSPEPVSGRHLYRRDHDVSQ